MAGTQDEIRVPAACPVCGRPRLAAYRPFCSKRCADVDLNRWLTGVYAVPAAPDADDQDDPMPAGDRKVD